MSDSDSDTHPSLPPLVSSESGASLPVAPTELDPISTSSDDETVFIGGGKGIIGNEDEIGGGKAGQGTIGKGDEIDNGDEIGGGKGTIGKGVKGNDIGSVTGDAIGGPKGGKSAAARPPRAPHDCRHLRASTRRPRGRQ